MTPLASTNFIQTNLGAFPSLHALLPWLTGLYPDLIPFPEKTELYH